MSLVEATANIVGAFLLALLTQIAVLPLFGLAVFGCRRLPDRHHLHGGVDRPEFHLAAGIRSSPSAQANP
jgi:hypothetical protein